MKFFNTLTRKVEDFVPNEEGKVSFYTCGPTVYHYAHIGNMRNYIGHDILDRTLRYLGYDVNRVMNITDVGHLSSDSDTGEDKMVSTAIKEKKSVLDIAAFYTEEFFKDFDALNCRRPDIVAPATEYISDYISIISGLVEKNIAYVAGGNVYFDVSKLADYYQLTNHKEDDMVVGSRESVGYDSNKRNQADFALWFTKSKFESQELKWPSPWGEGYPGWHIECSGIAMHYIGKKLDIHGGGVDNIFPHHTNEIAQSEAFLGHKWCNYWFHNEHLIDETGKMSKSKGGTLSVSTLKENGYNPLAFRYMCLTSHYRNQLVFSYEALNGAENAYNKLRTRIEQIKVEGELSEGDFANYNSEFINYLSDDLNTANALTVLYDLLKDETVNGHTKIELIKSFEKVLALDLIKEKRKREDHEEIMLLIESRNNAKKNKDYDMADTIRKELLIKGIVLIDTKDGTIYKEVGE